MNVKEDLNYYKKLVSNYERLTYVALALSREKDVNNLLEMILDEARAISMADAGTLYVLDEDKQYLNFAVMQNDTMNVRTRGEQKADEYPHISLYPKIPLYHGSRPNHSSVSSYVALKGKSLNIPDVYSDEAFDFAGPKEFDRATGYHTKSMLVIPMKNQKDEIVGVLQLINPKDKETGEVRPFTEEYVDVVAALASMAAMALTNTQLIDKLSHDLDTIKKLNETEADLNQRLRHAFLDVERSNEEIKAALRKARATRVVAAVVLLLFLIGAGGIYAWNRFFIQTGMLSRSAGPGGPGPAAGQTFIVTPQSISSSVSLAGKLEPLKQVSVVSPFTGKIAEKYFEYGQDVKKGQLLLRMDTEELRGKIRNATTQYIRARQKLDEIKYWSASPEVTQARRSLSRSNYSVDSSKRKLEEAKVLFDKGIISRAEYESADETLRNAELEFKSTQENLESILRKGSPENIKVAQFEFENAQAELTNLEEHLKRAEVLSPVTGIIILPKAAGTETKRVERGLAVNQGEMLFAVGDLEGFSVISQVDEIDIGKMRVGQKVTVTGDAFPDLNLAGKISRVSSQAGVSESYSKVPMFDVTVTIDSLSREQRERLRLGMTANLQVQVYNNPVALMLPIHLVETDGVNRWVSVKDRRTGEISTVQVHTGITTMDSVEILEGLQAGDAVVMVSKRARLGAMPPP